MTVRKNIELGLLITLCGAPGWAVATDYLEMDLEQLLQVRVTGSTLRDESLKTVPSVVTVFTRKQLDTLGLDYLFELMRLVPGFQVTRLGDNSINYSISASGRRTAVRAREIALVIDGRLIAEPRSAGVDSAFPLLPLANIERIEIIQGPGSAIYGSGAFTGLINIISRRTDKDKALTMTVGSDARRKLDLHWNQTHGDWQFNLFGHGYEDEGDDYQLLSGQSSADPRHEVMFDMGVQYRSSRLQLALIEQGGEQFYALEKVDNDVNQIDFSYLNISLEQAFQPADNWKMDLSYQYQSGQQTVAGMLAPAASMSAISQPASDDPLLVRAEFDSFSHKFALANDLSLASGDSLQFGFEWNEANENQGRAYNNFDLEHLVQGQLPIAYYGDLSRYTEIEIPARRHNYGAYGQWLHSLGENTRLTLGARYDQYETIGNHLSPRLGLVHQLNDHHSLKLLYGDAFRAPTFAETNLTNNPFLEGNPDLNHELVKTWDLVWLGMWQNSSFNLAAFHNQYADPIITGFNAAGARSFINSGDQESQGATLDIKQQIGGDWLMRLSLTRFTDLPDSAFAEADTLAAYILNYQKGVWNWNLSLNYQGEREYLHPASQRERLSGYWLANSHLRYQMSKDTKLTLTIKNLMDEDYASPPQGAGVVGGIPNRGREWILGLDWQW